MWSGFLNDRFKLIFHLETLGHLFPALLQILLPFPWLSEQSASQASYVVTPEMKHLRKISSSTSGFLCSPEDLKYSLPHPPEDHPLQVPGYFWALSPQPQAMWQNSLQKAGANGPRCHSDLQMIRKSVQNVLAVITEVCCWTSAGRDQQGKVSEEE